MFLKDFDKFFIGYGDLISNMSRVVEEAQKVPNFPPYNIRKVDDNKYVIEMAVAGFAKQDIEIELNDGKLVVKGNSTSEDSDDTVIYRGIGMRPFTRSFTLRENIEIQGAEMFNGILKIFLEAIIPEHKKPKRIEINSSKEG